MMEMVVMAKGCYVTSMALSWNAGVGGHLRSGPILSHMLVSMSLSSTPRIVLILTIQCLLVMQKFKTFLDFFIQPNLELNNFRVVAMITLFECRARKPSGKAQQN